MCTTSAEVAKMTDMADALIENPILNSPFREPTRHWAFEASHAEVFGAPPERDVTRWFSDASALTRAGIATVNYSTSDRPPRHDHGENLEIAGLAQTAHVYALAAKRVCGVV